MDAQQARTEYRQGRLSVDQLLEAFDKQARTIKRLEAKIERLVERLAQYEPEVRNEFRGGNPPQAETPQASQDYSVEAEEKRRHPRRRRKKSRGRRATCLKFAEAQRVENVYPPDAPPEACRLLRERAIWRLEEGQAVRVGYRIFRGPGGEEGHLPGVTPRCEYGLEILVVLAFLVYIIGISLDKACAVLGFFCHLPLRKSQADALLRQLARHWEPEFETICQLLAHAAVVYMDETGWKVGQERCALWTFASALVRVFLFGCHKDAATLDQMLPRDVFQGTGVSDDAAVYRHRFRRAQKCWAHLLRKAIRLALLYPRKKTYQRFLDELLEIFGDAKRAAADGRLSEAGRKKRVAELEGRLTALCQPYWQTPTAETPPHERDFRNLVQELWERMTDEELFTFVLDPDVEATNNLPERLQRGPAQDRDVGRTNQTPVGARRRTVIVSVLESLRVNLEQFTLASVVEEVRRWMEEGISFFAKVWQVVQEEQGLSEPSPVAAADTG